MTYRFYDFVTVVLDTAAQAYVNYFENEYRRIDGMRGDAADPPNRITVHVVTRLPPEEPGDIRRVVRFKKLFRFAYVVRGLASRDVHIYFRRHPVDRFYVTAAGVFLQAQVVEPILYLKLLQSRILLMHAAGVADERGGYIFPAQGGTGKTTLSLALVQNGFSLLGDDLVLVQPDTQTVYPYPRPLHLFTYNLRALPGTRIPWRLRATIRFKNVLRWVLERATGQEFLISTRAHVDEIQPDVVFSPPVQYRTVMFLRREGEDERVDLADPGARERVARIFIEAGDLNRSLFDNVVESGPFADDIRRLEVVVTSAVLEKLAVTEFINARRTDPYQVAMRLRA